ncbi:MAG TPA: LON peptidase substrate-binding domain-containing protein [Roseimicrobium sp.]|nr:LON peptidase substrate-binding domain-containing protein [Roseimicrobium sp.]
MQIPTEAPVMILSNAVLFPQAMLPLYIFEPRYRRMLADSLDTHRMFCIAMQKPGRTRETPSPVAGIGLIRASVNHDDGTSHLILQGIARVELGPATRYKPYRVHKIRPVEAEASDESGIEPLMARVRELVMELLQRGAQFGFPVLQQFDTSKQKTDVESLATSALESFLKLVRESDEPDQLADLISAALLPSPILRQAILEAMDLNERLTLLIQFLMDELRRNSRKKS